MTRAWSQVVGGRAFWLPPLAVVAVGALLFVGLFLRTFTYGHLSYGDLPPFPNGEIGLDLRTSLWWWDQIEGPSNRPGMTRLFVGLLDALVGSFNQALAQQLWITAPYLLAFVTGFVFLGRFTPSYPARCVGTAVYTVNVIASTNLVGGSVGIQYGHALLPLLAGWTWDAFGPAFDWRKLAALGLAVGTAISLSGHMLVEEALIALLVLAFVVARRSWRRAGAGLLRVGVASAVGLLLTAPWVIGGAPLFLRILGLAQTGAQSAAAAAGGSDVLDSLAADVQATYTQSLFEFATLGIAQPRLGYGQGSWLSAGGVVIPLLAFAAPLLVRGRQQRIALAWTSLALASLAFLYLTKLGLTLPLFRAFPPVFGLARNPGRPMLLLALAYAPLVAITAATLLRAGRQLWHRNSAPGARVAASVPTAALATGIVGLGLAFGPLFQGDMGLVATRGSFDQRMTVPQYFRDIEVLLEETRRTEGDFRTVWFPWEYQYAELQAQRIDPTNLQREFYRLGGSKYPPDDEVTPLTHLAELRGLACSGSGDQLSSFLGSLSVKYAIVDLGITGEEEPCAPDGDPVYLRWDPQFFADRLDRDPGLVVERRNEQYAVYRNLRFVPAVQVFTGPAARQAAALANEDPSRLAACLADPASAAPGTGKPAADCPALPGPTGSQVLGVRSEVPSVRTVDIGQPGDPALILLRRANATDWAVLSGGSFGPAIPFAGGAAFVGTAESATIELGFTDRHLYLVGNIGWLAALGLCVGLLALGGTPTSRLSVWSRSLLGRWRPGVKPTADARHSSARAPASARLEDQMTGPTRSGSESDQARHDATPALSGGELRRLADLCDQLAEEALQFQPLSPSHFLPTFDRWHPRVTGAVCGLPPLAGNLADRWISVCWVRSAVRQDPNATREANQRRSDANFARQAAQALHDTAIPLLRDAASELRRRAEAEEPSGGA